MASEFKPRLHSYRTLIPYRLTASRTFKIFIRKVQNLKNCNQKSFSKALLEPLNDEERFRLKQRSFEGFKFRLESEVWLKEKIVVAQVSVQEKALSKKEKKQNIHTTTQEIKD